MRKVMQQLGKGKMPDMAALMRQRDALTGGRRAEPLLSGHLWQFDFDSPASAGRRTPSGASSSPTSGPRATAE